MSNGDSEDSEDGEGGDEVWAERWAARRKSMPQVDARLQAHHHAVTHV